ncbi:hypothetical protein RFI_36561, partial [Reticulomyxa filosa]
SNEPVEKVWLCLSQEEPQGWKESKKIDNSVVCGVIDKTYASTVGRILQQALEKRGLTVTKVKGEKVSPNMEIQLGLPIANAVSPAAIHTFPTLTPPALTPDLDMTPTLAPIPTPDQATIESRQEKERAMRQKEDDEGNRLDTEKKQLKKRREKWELESKQWSLHKQREQNLQHLKKNLELQEANIHKREQKLKSRELELKTKQQALHSKKLNIQQKEQELEQGYILFHFIF